MLPTAPEELKILEARSTETLESIAERLDKFYGEYLKGMMRALFQKGLKND